MNFDNLTDFLVFLTDEKHIPTVDMQVFVKGDKVYDFRRGLKDGKNPVEIDNLYNLYSVSKVITCTAALQLYEKGKFLLTDPLYEYFPEFKEMYVKDDDGEDFGNAVSQGQKIVYADNAPKIKKAETPILIKDLFNMTAGFDYNLSSAAVKHILKEQDGVFKTQDIAKALSQTPLSFEPGTRWNYSLCHDLLGAFIEKISGMKFSEYLKKNIFEPLGMDSFTFERNDEIYEKMVDQFEYDCDSGYAHKISKKCEFIIGNGYESGGAGLCGSPEDYGKFVCAMSMGGTAGAGNRILSENTVNLMKQDFLTDETRKTFNWIQLSGYGYGLGVRTHIAPQSGGGLSPLGEFGWGGAAGAYILIDTKNNVGIYYAQHMKNNLEPFVHPRLRNITYSCLDK